MEDSQNTHDPATPRARYVRRATTAVAGAAVLVALSFGVALAASSDDGTPSPGETTVMPSPEGPSDYPTEVPPHETGGTSGGVDGGATGGIDPSPTATSPTSIPSSPNVEADLAKINRRISQLNKKIDQLPTKKDLADALRAFADELDKSE
ncbi:hypothetical protein [Streptomyces colonosanans]|uniref:Uncharacterized protein n=1 Tax=Streptomyces colonosanans TaxID=1428652 RepID=A0A1S2NV28_9ACTN|nr:hypothetical protein [Streptomyces colonosanans]OIJ85112.1 hypothetical protein BIV24_29290 [Streptomyces colonosanans]